MITINTIKTNCYVLLNIIRIYTKKILIFISSFENFNIQNIFELLVQWFLEIINEIFMYFKMCIAAFSMPVFNDLWMQQLACNIFTYGIQSIITMIIVGIFLGAAIAFQFYFLLTKIGATPLIGMAVTRGIICDLGDVLVALIIAGKTSTSISSEIGHMKNSEQIDALISMGISPEKYIISPKILSMLICMPILTTIHAFSGIFSGKFISIYLLNISHVDYIKQASAYIGTKDVLAGILIKPLVFAFIISSISCFYGMKTQHGINTIREYTVKAVVYSYIGIMSFNCLFVCFYGKVVSFIIGE